MERGVHPEHFEDGGVEVREVGDELVPCGIVPAEPGEFFAQFVLDLRVFGEFDKRPLFGMSSVAWD
jgi:hypothetical protein